MDSGTEIYRFAPFELDSGRRCLSCGGQPVALSPRLFDILLLLVSHAGLIVTRDELMKAGWGLIVSEASVSQAIKTLRDTLGSQDDRTSCIETLIGRGYRFRAPVECTTPSEPEIPFDALLAPYGALREERERRCSRSSVTARPSLESRAFGLFAGRSHRGLLKVSAE